MLCQEIMKSNVTCVSCDDPVDFAAKRMRDENIGFVPVCDSSGQVLGTLTDRDIAIRLVAESCPADTLVANVMTCEVIACKPSDDVRKAEKLMGTHQKSRIMCLDANGHLAGVISLSDIAQCDEPARAARTMRQITDRETHA